MAGITVLKYRKYPTDYLQRVRYSLFYRAGRGEYPNTMFRLFRSDLFLDKNGVVNRVKFDVTFSYLIGDQFKESTKISKHNSVYRGIFKAFPKLTHLADNFTDYYYKVTNRFSLEDSYRSYFQWLSVQKQSELTNFLNKDAISTLGETLIRKVVKHGLARSWAESVPLSVGIYSRFGFNNLKKVYVVA